MIELLFNRERSSASQIFELKNALAYVTGILNTIREPLVVLYPKQTVKWANKSFYKTFKTDTHKIEGKLIYELSNKQWDIPLFRKLLEEILGKRTSFYDYEVEINFDNTGPRIMLLNARKLFVKGEDQMILLAIEDVTERRALERKLENEKHILSENQHLHELTKQRDDFFSLASHELKTPVTSIKTFTQLLQMKFKAEGNINALWMLTIMNKQIDKLTHLINDLLDATKIENGKLKYNESHFDFNELVTEIVGEMQLTETVHSIEVNLCETHDIFGDRERIGQVITHLVANAIRFSPNADKIIITATNSEPYIALSIKDFGIGILEERQNKIFEKFFRGSGNTEDCFPGLGLGLFMSAEIIKRHKGTMIVESTKDMGSTFSFTLPVSEPVIVNN